jgi:hypothetical protein
MPIDPQASSEELLLLAWERWDQVCLQRVIGDYSFGLWGAQEECFWCARDFVGPRPFFMQTPAVSSPSATHWIFFGKCRRCQGRSMRNFLAISSWGFLRACPSPGTTGERIAALLETGLDWNVLLELAGEHGVQVCSHIACRK